MCYRCNGLTSKRHAFFFFYVLIQIVFDNKAHSGRIKISLDNDIAIRECKDWHVSGSSKWHKRVQIFMLNFCHTSTMFVNLFLYWKMRHCWHTFSSGCALNPDFLRNSCSSTSDLKSWERSHTITFLSSSQTLHHWYCQSKIFLRLTVHPSSFAYWTYTDHCFRQGCELFF